MYHKIEQGAIFIADVHYPNHTDKFIDFLKDILDGKINTTQLFLMGDIFDLLVDTNSYLIEYNKEAIELIKSISKNIEVIYLEGNHDFCLDNIFTNCKVVNIGQQPLLAKDKDFIISISHGDVSIADFKYKIYSKIIRNRSILKFIPTAYAKNKLIKLSKKNICKKIPNFKAIVATIISKNSSDLIIEGHFHQGVVEGRYTALPSFACSLE